MKTYTIEQGNHSANGLNFKIHNNLHQLNFKAILHSNCLYHLGNVDDMDVNKLYGVTWSLFNDKNSFRIGWNCQNNDGKISYFAYMHKDGQFSSVWLFDEFPEIEMNFHIEFDRIGNFIRIYRLDIPTNYSISYNFAGVGKIGYYNWPYFGGNQVAPQTMNIGIE